MYRRWSPKFSSSEFSCITVSVIHQTDVTFSLGKEIFYSWFTWKINLVKVLVLMGIRNLTSVFLRIINRAAEHWGLRTRLFLTFYNYCQKQSRRGFASCSRLAVLLPNKTTSLKKRFPDILSFRINQRSFRCFKGGEGRNSYSDRISFPNDVWVIIITGRVRFCTHLDDIGIFVVFTNKNVVFNEGQNILGEKIPCKK